MRTALALCSILTASVIMLLALPLAFSTSDGETQDEITVIDADAVFVVTPTVNLAPNQISDRVFLQYAEQSQQVLLRYPTGLTDSFWRIYLPLVQHQSSYE